MSGLSKMKKRNAARQKQKRERRKAEKHLRSSLGSGQGGEGFPNSTAAAKGVLLSTI